MSVVGTYNAVAVPCDPLAGHGNLLDACFGPASSLDLRASSSRMSSPEDKGLPTSWWVPPKLLTAALLFAFFLVWTLDPSAAPRPTLQSRYYLGTFSAASPARNLTLTHTSPSPEPAIIPTQNSWLSIPKNESSSAPKPTVISSQRTRWLTSSSAPNFTSTLLSRWLAPGGEPCRDSRTAAISIPALDIPASIELPTGEVHEFAFSALDDAHQPRCLGGDYFETDLSGEQWKSRPPITDHGNGSYSLKLQVHPRFSGAYELTIVLLFRSFEGLKISPERFKFRKELRRIPITFRRSDRSPLLPELQICQQADFSHEAWSGRWTRHAKNDACSIDGDGRYRCLDSRLQCERPWCEGPLGALESNGWVYSVHCSFRLFTLDSAWQCLRNRWLFFWGDSNHVDTIRNLLNFVLGHREIASVPRRFDMKFANPRNNSESVRITSIFNGHWNETMNYLGLQSLQNEQFQQLLWRYFSEDSAPDTLILNSGLHDGVYWRSIRAFSEGAEYAARFWEEVMRQLLKKENMKRPPRLFYRTTIAVGGYARDLAFNPAKMEAFNGVFVEKLREKGLLTGGVIDEFDMTFPWHYDNRCNDGVHYGRAPAKVRWRDGEVGHQYFVDLMLGHVLLNAICSS